MARIVVALEIDDQALPYGDAHSLEESVEQAMRDLVFSDGNFDAHSDATIWLEEVVVSIELGDG
jgi:hypothetical protein